MKVHRRVGGTEGSGRDSGRKPKTDWTTEVTQRNWSVEFLSGCYNIQVAALQ